MARVKEYTLTGFALSTNGIAASQDLEAGVPMVLEAAAASLSPPRELDFDGSAAISGTLTIVGTDRYGNPQTEVISGLSTSTITSKLVWASVTSITPSATDTDTVVVGWPARTVSPWVPCGRRVGSEVLPSARVSMIELTGAGDGTVEVTYDSNQSPAKSTYPHIFEASAQRTGYKVDETIALTPLTPVSAQGVYCRVVLTSGAATAAVARIAIPGP
jgi:hypothetical protein